MDNTEQRVVAQVLAELSKRGIDTTPALRQLGDNKPDEALNLAFREIVVAPPEAARTGQAEDTTTIAMRTDTVYELTEFAVPVTVSELYDDYAVVWVDGERHSLKLTESAALPAPADNCRVVLTGTAPTEAGSGHGNASVSLRCR